MNFWQIAAGEGSRDYSSVFLQFGIMLVGSGNPGSFSERQDYYKGHHDWRAQVVRFAETAKLGDMVILKRPYRKRTLDEGRWEIVAVGHVTGNYEYYDLFDDVEGWDLQHCRKVDWVCPKEKVYVDGLARGTFKRVYSQAPKDEAIRILNEGEEKQADVLPNPAGRVSDEQLVEGLVDNGLRPADAETVIRTIWRVRRLARWYHDHGRDISEHETRTFLIVPILQALGWSEQKMKIEWRNTDIAFFSAVYKGGKESREPCMILESKRMWEGLRYAERQAERYARDYPRCSRLVISDGVCYRLYRKEDNNWNWKAYVNLLKLKDRHPYYTEIGGASEVFVSLMPYY